jgi:hypothetical protein
MKRVHLAFEFAARAEGSGQLGIQNFHVPHPILAQ